MERFGKKIITILLSVAMLMTFTPTVAFAADLGSYDVQEVTDEVTEPSVDLQEDAETAEAEEPKDELQEEAVTEESVDGMQETAAAEEVQDVTADQPMVQEETPTREADLVTIPDNGKFMVRVSSQPSSGDPGEVTGIVYDDFSGRFTIGTGLVNQDNVTVQVWLKDVGSLGIEGVRNYERVVNTGLGSADHDLNTLVNFLNDLHSATVAAQVKGGHSVTYTVVHTDRVITAEPDTYDNAACVWHEIVNDDNLEVVVNDYDDSSALIKAGSYFQIEDKVLYVQNDLVLNDLESLAGVETLIRNAVEYRDAETTIEGVKAYLVQGSELRLGQTGAKVKSACMTVTSDIAVTTEMKNALEGLQNAASNQEMAEAVMGLVAGFLGKMDGTTTHVEFSFDHNWGEATYKWAADHSTCTATRTCLDDPNHVDTETVEAVPSTADSEFPFEGTVTTYVANFTHEGLETQTYVAPGTYKDFKFAVSVSSKAADGSVGSVTGIVYPDYQGVLTIGEGLVNQDNMTVGVWMKDVASLGVEGIRSYTRTLNTGMASQDHSLDTVRNMFSKLEEATVIAKVEGGSAVTYTIINNGSVITATPGKADKARAVWHEIVNSDHVLAGVDDDEDSSAVIKAGSFLQVEDMVLLAESDVVVDNLDNLEALNAAIRGAVVYKKADKPIEGVKLFLAKDTELNMGTSYAKVAVDCMTITADVAATKEMKDALEGLKNAVNTNDMMAAAFAGMTEILDAMNETSTTVTFAFSHKMTEHAAVDATCEEAGNAAYFECEHCGKLFTDEAGTTETTADALVTPATGHEWGVVVYSWTDDHTHCTASRTCLNDNTHVDTEEAEVTVATVNEDFPFNGEVTTYTATFKNEAFATQVYIDSKDSQDFKFAVSVSSEVNSGEVGSVTGIVYPNYQGVLSINGENVSKDNITVGVWMKNVESLGVEGIRSYKRTIDTGMEPSVSSLQTVENLFSGLHEATVIAKVNGGHSVTYTLVNEGRTITATPASENSARSVWHEIVNEENIKAGTTDDEDSSALIKAGSYIQVEDMILLAESDVAVDNLDDLSALNTAIRNALVYKTADEPIEGVKVYVAQGTRLDLGTSYAEWNKNCMSIKSDVPATQAMKDALAALKDAGSTDAMMTAVFTGISEFCKAINDKTTTVEFTFGHELIKHEAVEPTCEEAGNTEYYECEICGKFFSNAEGTMEIEEDSWIIPAITHDWNITYTWAENKESVVAVAICKNDPAHMVVETVVPVGEVTTEAACETAGETTYTATFTKEPFETQTKTEAIEALGHDWGDPAYEWAEDHSSCKGTAVCKNDNTHIQTEDAEINSEIVSSATCEGEGVKSVTATFTKEPFTTQTVTEAIGATGHDWNTPSYVWAEDYSTCTAIRVCKNNVTHVETETVDAVPAVVYDEFPHDGSKTTYTATFTNAAFETQTATDETQSQDYKFAVSVSSTAQDGTIGSVTGIVYPNYNGVLSINGNSVSKDNLTVGVWMNNVDSLGVEGERHYERTISTGMGASNSSLSVVENLFSGLHEATVIAKVEDGHSVTYTVTNEGRKITAVPASENNARSVWHEIVNDTNINYGTDSTDDSSALIKAGSFIQIENMILLAEKDVAVDNLNDLDALNAAIRDAVVYKTADKTIEGVKVHIAQGTRLDLGTSYAEWNQNCMSVTADVQATQAMKDALGGLKNAGNIDEMMSAMFTGISEFCTAIDDTTTTVVFSFGHKLIAHEEVKATCEEGGNNAYWECENCGKFFSDEDATTEIEKDSWLTEALDHIWGEPTYMWSDDFSTCTATRVCERDPSHIETQTVTTTSVTVEPTTTENGKTTYTADFDEPFEDQTHEVVIPATGHQWGEPEYTWSEDNGTVTATLPCTDDPTLTVTETVETTWEWVEGKEATCTEPGQKIYTAHFGNTRFEDQTKTVDVPALGHDWGEPAYAWDGSSCTATSVCGNDETHVLTETVTANSEVTTPATCEGKGETTYTATFKNELFETQTKTESIPATGHAWGTPTYTWAEDYSTCTAERVCAKDNNHVETETVESVPATVYDEFPLNGSKTTYTADFENEAFETQTANGETESQDYKFAFEISSVAQNGTEGSVTGIVYPNYEGVLSINGDYVSKDNVTVGVWMKDVASLGVDGVRHYERTINTGMEPSNSPLAIVETLFSGLHEATVIGKVEGGHSVTYTVVNEGRKITATPASENSARAVWHEIVNTDNIDYGTDDTDDSSALIKAGSFIQVEDMILLAEKDVTVDNLNDLDALNAAIRDAVVYKTAEKPIEGVKVHIAQGTRLDLGTSYAEWIRNCMSITADVQATQAMKDALSGLQSAANVNDMMTAMFTGISEFCKAIDDTTTTVVFSFGHKLTEHEAVEATCEEGGNDAYWECENCGQYFSDAGATTTIEEDGWLTDALGHDWGTPAYTWSDDLKTVVAVSICKNNPAHIVVETANVTSQTTDPTCEDAGKTVYTATFEKEPFTTQTKEVEIPATGHDWGEPTYVWAADNSTCTATSICKNDDTHILTENGKVTSVDTTPATCEEAGVRTYTATFENEPFETQTTTAVIEALGHDWDTENIEFQWSDDHSSCTAIVTCKRDENHKMELPCEVTSETVGNCTTYTATVTIDGETFTDVIKVDGVMRVYGHDRYKTSLKVAEFFKEISRADKFDAVVIATGSNFPDALTGADLAIRNNAPLMMINGGSAEEVTAYIKANLAADGKVYILGGTKAVEDAWISDLSSYEVKRLDGKSRYDTNLSILNELGIKGGDLFICTGTNFADALSASAIDMPIMIVGDSLTDKQKAFLTEGSGWNFHIVGGTGAVKEEVEEELKDYGTVVDRTSGHSRYETSTALAVKFVPAATQAVLAVGDNYPDGLCGGPVAYKMEAPIILSGTRGAMCGDGIKYAMENKIYAGIVLGGPSDKMINDDTVKITFSMGEEDEVIVYKPE